MKFTVLTAAAVLGATAAFAQTTAPSGTPASGAMTSPTPGSMPSTESMTTPPAGTATPNASGTTRMASESMTEQMARQKLAASGYGSVTNLKRTPDGQWEAMTKNGSKQERITIAPDGSVTPKAPQ